MNDANRLKHWLSRDASLHAKLLVMILITSYGKFERVADIVFVERDYMAAISIFKGRYI
jgi:hypothetical protein